MNLEGVATHRLTGSITEGKSVVPLRSTRPSAERYKRVTEHYGMAEAMPFPDLVLS